MSYQGRRINPPSIVLDFFFENWKCTLEERKLLGIGCNSMPKGSQYVLPKAITAEAGHLDMSQFRVAMEE